MRILLSCQQSLRRHTIPAYEFWRKYFVGGIAEAGHQVLEIPEIDWAEGLAITDSEAREAWRVRTWELALELARREPVDLFLGYLFPQQVEPGAIRELQRLGIPCVNFFCDNVREFVRVPREFRPFALHWVPEPGALPLYEEEGLSALPAPMPCWVEPGLRMPASAETEPATFTGSADILRRDLLGRAMICGADFVVRGRGWTGDDDRGSVPPPGGLPKLLKNQFALVRDHGIGALAAKIEGRMKPVVPPPIPESRIGPLLNDAEYVRVCREAKVAIGVNRVTNATHPPRRPLVYSRLRDVEAPMLGACYLTERAPGLETMYQLGAEIEIYSTAEELAEKLGALLGDSARRKRMRKLAQRRALEEHCVGRTIARIAAHFGL